MGIFDDEARKMAVEAAQQARSDVERADEINQIAHDVSDDLLTHLASRSQAEGINIGIHGNIVRATTRHRTLEIVCEGPDAFHLNDRSSGFQAQVMAQLPRPISTRGAPITGPPSLGLGARAARRLNWRARAG